MQPLAIFGITGRMGQSLLAALNESSVFTLSGAIASAQSQRLGQDAAVAGPGTGILVTADAGQGIRGAAVALDFSLHASVAAHAQVCAAARVPLVVGVTGYEAAGRRALEQAARDIPLLVAPNTSIGVGIATQLVALAAQRLGAAYEVEIFDAHHRHKRDAPSGTALALGRAVAQARGQNFDAVATYDWTEKTGPHTPGSIGFSVLRAGDIVGEHTVSFSAAGERIEITHRATDRMTFARGALKAADWLVRQPKGLYTMQNMLGA